MYENREHQTTQSIIEELARNATRAAQVEKYGPDRPIYRHSMVALLDIYGINPKHSDKIRGAVDRWRESIDYTDYFTGRLEVDLLGIDPSDNMKALCYDIAVNACRMEEAHTGLI